MDIKNQTGKVRNGMAAYDVVIIGAGVCGASIARELAKTKRRIAVLEKASDVCEGTSKANSGIVHAGHDAMPGTLKAKLNVMGNEKMEELSRVLDFPFQRNGSLVLCFEQEGMPGLRELAERGKSNGVGGIRILTPEQVWEMEPNVSREIKGALYAPTGGIVCPFGMNIAFAENAAENGVDFYFEHKVDSIEVRLEGSTPSASESLKNEQVLLDKPADGNMGIQAEKNQGKDLGRFVVLTEKEEFQAHIVINAAGVHGDEIHNMVCGNKMKLVPRRGEYCLMDKEAGGLIHATIFQQPSSLGKGILVTPTVHGNLLVGPTAEDIDEKEGINTTAKGLEEVLSKGARSVEGLPVRQVITSFAGLRAHGENNDFIIGEASEVKGFFDVAGIESPGLTCAPAIGEYVAKLVNEKYPADINESFQETRKGIPNMALADEEERKRLLDRDPSYANVVCRCEMVTEGEILDAIRRPLGATTLDGIKRRTRAGMGRCQAGFCSPRVVEILAEELKVDEGDITKSGGASRLLAGYNHLN